MTERPMLIVVSDIHLTDALHGASIPRADTFERFWIRIQDARGTRPAVLCFAGDLFDLVRSPRWFEGKARPYHNPSPEVIARVDEIVHATLERERGFFDAIRRRVQEGALEVHYVLGNHDRLLRYAPAARRAIWRALTGEDREVEFPFEQIFADHAVLVYHGNVVDDINSSPDGGGTIGDAIGIDLITGFPREVRRLLDASETEYETLDDIDDVRPVYAVPAWVRRLGMIDRRLLRPVSSAWSSLVEEFLSNDFVRAWMRRKHRRLGLDAGKKLRLLLELSTRKVMAHTHDQRLTRLYKYFQHGFDGKMARRAAEELARPKSRDLRYVVNGHSHFASMVPLGNVRGHPAVYFNTGTWRTVHQIGYDVGGRPSFLPYDAMSYLVFFPAGDPMGRDYEWWTGAVVASSIDGGTRGA